MTPHLCRWIRWKGFYGASFRTEADLLDAFLRADAAFSCLSTAQPWGPDDQLCTPEGCTPARSCFERSPKAPPRSIS